MDFKQNACLLEKQLAELNSTQDNILVKADKAIVLCRVVLCKFKTEIIKNGFSDLQKEILFFKQLKQVPLSSLVYYFKIKSFEVIFPKGNKEIQKKYIHKKLNKLNRFYLNNLDFSQYIEQGKTYMDDRYFTTKYSNEFNITHSKHYLRDPKFSSSHDLLLAKLYANLRVIEYMERRLVNLDKPKSKINRLALKQLNWTGSKTDMTELGYALKYRGSINNGNTSVNEIIQQLERIFNFNSGDPYKNYSEMRLRKKSRTKFLDELAISLQSKMGNDDF